MKKILETKRLYLRELEISDMPSLRAILQDKEVMYAYEHAFSDAEVHTWYQNQRRRYQENGYGLWAVIWKETNEMIGQCGLTNQEIDGTMYLEIGYLFNKTYWHKGYAIEAASACKEYAFDVLHADEVYSIIRDTNIASMNVAIRNDMIINTYCIKDYYHMKMPHYIFKVEKAKNEFLNERKTMILEI